MKLPTLPILFALALPLAAQAAIPGSKTSAPRRVLVVIDVQNEYVTGNLPIEYPDVQASLRNIGAAMDAARRSGIPVVVIQNQAPLGSPLFARGSDGWQLHPVVASRPHDHYAEKSLPDAFAGTDLAEYLAAQGADTLTVVGYMTHNCVDSTVKHALHAGFNVEFLQDASGSVPYKNSAGEQNAKQIHQAFSVVMQSRFAAVLDTSEWIDGLASGALPERDSIYRSNQRARGKTVD